YNSKILHSFPTRRSSDLKILWLEQVMAHIFKIIIQIRLPLINNGLQCIQRLRDKFMLIKVRKMRFYTIAKIYCQQGYLKCKEIRSEEHTSELQSRENLVC